MLPGCGGKRRPSNFEILGAAGVGAHQQRRVAAEIRMMLDLVAHRRLARRDQHWLGIRIFQVDEPRFGRVVVAHRYGGEAARLQTRQRHEPTAVGHRINLDIVTHIRAEAVTMHARGAMLSVEADVIKRRAVSRPYDIARGLPDDVRQFRHAGEVAHPNGEKLSPRLVCAPCKQSVIRRMRGGA